MSIRIDPNTLYTRDELVSLIGRAAFERTQVDGGLYAVGDLYLGLDILECIRKARQAIAEQRAANRPDRKGDPDHEEANMEANRQDERLAPSPRSQRAADVLRALEEGG